MSLPSRYRVRPAQRDDVEAITSIFVEQETILNGEAESTPEDFYGDWSAPGVEMERDTVTIWDGERLVGYAGIAQVTRPDIYSAYGSVRPSDCGRGLGTYLFDTVERRVVEKAGGEASIRQWIDAKDKSAIAILEGRGYAFVRRFWRMDLSLDEAVVEPRGIEGLTIRGFVRGEDERAAHDALQDSFKDHWGHTPRTYEEMKASHWDAEWFRSDLSLVAIAEEGVVGICINGARHDDGFVEDLGVIPGWRGRGVAEALLRTSFRLFKELGMQRASLNVDSDNSTGAMRLYEKVGMTNGTCYDVYERRLEP